MQKIRLKGIDLKTRTKIEQQGIKAKKQTQKCNKPRLEDMDKDDNEGLKQKGTYIEKQ